MACCVFFFNDTATTEIYTYGHTLSLHDALPISGSEATRRKASGEAGSRCIVVLQSIPSGQVRPPQHAFASAGAGRCIPLNAQALRTARSRRSCRARTRARPSPPPEIGRAHV